MKAFEREEKELLPFTITWAAGVEPIAVSTLRSKEKSSSTPSSTSNSLSTSSTAGSDLPPSAFNVGFGTSFTPAFGGARSDFGFSQAPSFATPPAFSGSAAFADDYEAATLAKMKSRDLERKRLAEEMMRQDQEEEDHLRLSQESKEKKVKT
ncbi:hypothetical protein BX616_004376 [Lobosporangium transversale]|nr:hypothetical protein BX616_004376 [Lobosporangium transversale]